MLRTLLAVVCVVTTGTLSTAQAPVVALSEAAAPTAADTLPPESEPAPLLIPGRPNPVDSAVVDRAREAREQFELARTLEAKHPATAILTYRKALRLDPALREANYRIGLLFNTRAQWTEAAKSFAAEIERHPEHVDAARELGIALARAGDPARAIPQLERLARRRPQDGRMWHALGFAYSRAGRAREAERAIRKAIALPPHDVEEHRDLGALLASLGREREAREEYRRALVLAPGDPATWINLGNLERRAGRRDSALTCYRRAVEGDSLFALGYQGQVQVLRELKRSAETVEVFRRWLARIPAEHGARLEAVQLLLAMGEGDEALALARAGVEASPRSGPPLAIYGMALAGRGRHREALARLREAQKSFGPDAGEVERVEKMIAVLRAGAPDSLRALFQADSIGRARAGGVPARGSTPSDTAASARPR